MDEGENYPGGPTVRAIRHSLLIEEGKNNMTFWKTDRQKQTAKHLVSETLSMIEHEFLTEQLIQTPEWTSVTTAAKDSDQRVLAIALEVVASHHAESLPSPSVDVVEAVADAIRHGRNTEMKALLDLIKRSCPRRLAA